MRLMFLPLFAGFTLLLTPQDPQQPQRPRLAQDATVGTVLDRQGTALVRPVGRQRWTPLAGRAHLLPGDQVRTDARGANAVEVELTGGGSFILGPGGLCELTSAAELRLDRGEIEVKAGKQPLQVTAPGLSRAVAKTAVLRSDGQKTSELQQPPPWLLGYRSSTTDEWMGSLIAQVDGRDVPLNVGYHKVDVEVHDQVARTIVEESFVNTTNGTLEGQFFFPLPADASISGFGMWIGDELVEADIVEKQRARAIYEDILRNRKDPGLLEWSGGNLFKARVFPIQGHSEKRIRLCYTQVLPLEGSTVRYRYALRSELLRQHPLRELSIQMLVSSTAKVVKAECKSHAARVRTTEHSASVEFTASEFTPDRDFEVQISLAGTQGLTVVPHRRGSDGYFMLLLSPPGSDTALQRQLVPEGAPLDLVLVADTSGSMDQAARAAQAGFLTALLGCLGPKDRFRLMTCDVAVHWLREEPMAADEQGVQAALKFLDQRPSLGWTDLDLAVGQAISHAMAGTTVVYVGDGIQTSGAGDEGLAQRLREKAKGSTCTFHAVITGPTHDRSVLEAMASIGGGSVRATDGDPAACAQSLLAEVAQPTVKDLAVRFEGIQTARVYPERLPNLAAGTQQIVLGRFLPAGAPDAAQHGTVVVTGTLAGKPVRYTAELSLDSGANGNSFLPRLWARRHIDALLDQGRGKAIQEQVVAFSEEFGIMTPFTSFLVLENDADRERYGVQRRVKMRDGEQFFADAHARAAAELQRQQTELARSWRVELRRQMLRELATLGRRLQAIAFGGAERGQYAQLGAVGGKAMPISRTAATDWKDHESFREGKEELDLQDKGAESDLAADGAPESEESGPSPAEPTDAPASPAPALERSDSRARNEHGAMKMLKRNRDEASLDDFDDLSRLNARNQYGYAWSPQPANFLFPWLPPPSAEAPDFQRPDWPAEVLAEFAALYRRKTLAGMTQGLRLLQRGGTVHPLRGHATGQELAEGRIGPDGWWVRGFGRGSPPVEQYVAGGKRGVVNTAVQLGRERAAAASDRAEFAFPFRDLSLTDLVRTYAGYAASVEPSAAGLLVVTLTAPAPQQYAFRLKIDRGRHVVLESQSLFQGKVTSVTRCEQLVEKASLWWPTRITTLDEQQRVVARYELEVQEYTANEAKDLVAGAVQTAGVIMLGAADPTVDAAKQSVLDGHAGFAEHFALALHFTASQQWDRVAESWQAAERTVAGKPGAAWLRGLFLAQGRKQQELKELLARLAPQISSRKDAEGVFLAQHAISMAQGALEPNEVLVLLDAVEPAFAAGDDAAWQHMTWQRLYANLLQAAGRNREAIDLHRQILAARPFEIDAVTGYLDALWQGGERKAAIRCAEDNLAGKWLAAEATQLYERITNFLWETRELAKLKTVLEAWLALVPEQEGPWQRWLSTLLFLDRQQEADAWVAAQFAVELTPALDAAQRARTSAAIGYCLGQGWNFYGYQIEQRWMRPLADLARALLRVEEAGWYLSARILGDWRFLQSDAAAWLRTQLAADLAQQGAVETMPLERLARCLAVLQWDRAQADQQLWRRTTDRLKARWLAAPETERATLAGLVLQLLDAHLEPQEAIAFTRTWLAAAGADMVPQVARQLMRRLVQVDWTGAVEDELFALLPRLQPSTAEALTRKAIALSAVRWLTDRLLDMRIAALMGPAKEYELLPRSGLRQKQATARNTARTALAARLLQARAVAGEPAWRPLELERLCLLAEVGDNLKQVDGEVRELLFAVPEGGDTVDVVLRERCAFVVGYCASRQKAPAGLADGAVALLRRFAAAPTPATSDYATDWRYHLYRLLVALDRPDALLATLHEWIQPEKAETRWRLAYGWLLAESGQLADAARTFETVATDDELGAREYDALAQWYLALGRAADRERAQLMHWQVMPEQELTARIYQATQQLQSRGDGVPGSLDPDVLRAIQALLHKATYPANHLGSVQQLYEQCKDFRVLESVADGVLGHTAEAVYPFLQQVSGITASIHEEATCDRLIARIADLQAAARTDVDRRALLLLTMMVERRAAEVLNQPGPHLRLCLQAMQTAFQQAWLPGEHLLMAGLLASLGKLPQAELAAEQLRQLEVLHGLATAGTFERLQLALFLDQVRWSYDQHDQALDHLTAALDELRTARAGNLSADADSALDTLASWLENRQHFASGETLLRSELSLQTAAPQQAWLSQRLFALYVRCLEHGGSTALGSAEALYDQVRRELEQFLFRAGEGQLREGVGTLCNLHRAAARAARIARAAGDLEAFAHERLPELLTSRPDEVWSLVATVGQTIVELSGHRAGLRFLVERLEAEPAFYARLGQDGWNSLAWMLADWRTKAGALGELEPRLLRLVLRQLERDLLTMQQRNRAMYGGVHSGPFWSEHAADFAAAAERVIAQNQDSPARLLYAADYLWGDLDLHERAVAVLASALERDQIRDDGRYRLVGWLHFLERFQESLPVIAALLEAHPENLDYRVAQVHALHGTRRDAEGEAFVKDTQTLFQATGRWNENAINVLANVSLQCGYHARAILLYEELIPLHQRTAPNRGAGDGTLSYYCQALAQARIALGLVDEAIDAASAAIVAWGRDQHNRRSAIESLLSVVRQVKDLDALIARHDAKVKASGSDAPVLRKAFAMVWLERGAPAKAVPQLLAARALQADDAEVHAALVAACDQLRRPREACAALLFAIDATPRNLDLSRDLGRRFLQLRDTESAERAFTNLVEVLPEEAESHRRLAQQREEQQRFPDAVVQWQHVVRIRTDEPEGWLGLARAQDRAGDRDGARRTLQQVLKAKWAPRFGDVEQQAMQMLGPMSQPPR